MGLTSLTSLFEIWQTSLRLPFGSSFEESGWNTIVSSATCSKHGQAAVASGTHGNICGLSLHLTQPVFNITSLSMSLAGNSIITRSVLVLQGVHVDVIVASCPSLLGMASCPKYAGLWSEPQKKSHTELVGLKLLSYKDVSVYKYIENIMQPCCQLARLCGQCQRRNAATFWSMPKEELVSAEEQRTRTFGTTRSPGSLKTSLTSKTTMWRLSPSLSGILIIALRMIW